jgi:predicted N-acetyltransferase YhbS
MLPAEMKEQGMGPHITHLFEHPEHLPTMAGWLFEEFGGDSGKTIEAIEGLLRRSMDADHLPMSLLAFEDGQPVGIAVLMRNDAEPQPRREFWLVALLVLPEHRHRGYGIALVRGLLGEAKRVGLSEVFLGTRIPDFYAPLGADVIDRVNDDRYIMRFALSQAAT